MTWATTGSGSSAGQNGNGSLGHYGLLGMQQRVEMDGGSWAINPNTPRGTWVPAVVPHGLSDDLHDARDAATLER